jgi:hypothetical protein
MSEHVQSALPKPAPKSTALKQLEDALASAESHLALLRGRCGHNTAAIRNQLQIIEQYKARIKELSEDSWLSN